MKIKQLLIALSLLVPCIGYTCPTLDGTWTSSKEKFVEFNKRWANVESKAWNFMIQTQGIETIEFKASGNMIIDTPEVELVMGKNKIKRPSSKEQTTYKILGCNSNSIVLEYQRNGKTQISHLQFDNDNTYWEYMGKPGRSGNGHIREYYTREQ
jgi:hypothetical protein